ncbi:MAG: prepilin-type N-terminal cleavage/methylation domain-containing protein, partial [Lachnospiraceae bacterium]|nr:prepilin-type N-terminal cleavage/methylation domain-containing protein [Lachnospiraceae bacterium]
MRDKSILKNAHSRKNKGFTLVELIVVLVVICILASVAVLSIVGYIDRSRYNKNEQNAISIYQAAQSAVNKYAFTGEQEDWILSVLIAKGTLNPYMEANPDKDANGIIRDKCFNKIDYDNFTLENNNAGESVHMRYVLTNTKNGTDDQSKALQNLLSGYMYDSSVFSATFSVEFDVEKTIGSDKSLHYAVNVYSVFYDEGRDTWDEVAKYVSTSLAVVPYREEAYRENTSLVGYFSGINPSAVDTVALPDDEKRIEFYELTLRNDETLDLTFSAHCGDD